MKVLFKVELNNYIILYHHYEHLYIFCISWIILIMYVRLMLLINFALTQI